MNQPCPLAATDLGPGATWRCADGLTCTQVVTNPAASFALGACVPAQPSAGLACRTVVLDEGDAPATPFAANLRAYADRVTTEALIIGVPLGRVQRNCRSDERSLGAFTAGTPPELCAILGGEGFEAMARGTFSGRRFAEAVVRGVLDTCGPARPCREDYICQAVPRFLAGISASVFDRLDADQLGFCTPTYFIYQLRLDGHPDPRRSALRQR